MIFGSLQEEDDILDLTSRRRATTIRVTAGCTKKRSSYKLFMSLVDNKEKMDRNAERNITCLMVFAGQDAWRKHPLISGCWKQPFPHIKLAAGLFAAYLVASTTINMVMKPPESGLPHKPLTKYKKASEFGDTMPEGGLRHKHH